MKVRQSLKDKASSSRKFALSNPYGGEFQDSEGSWFDHEDELEERELDIKAMDTLRYCLRDNHIINAPDDLLQWVKDKRCELREILESYE